MHPNQDRLQVTLETRRGAIRQELATVAKQIKETELIQARLERRIQVLERRQRLAA